MSVLIIPGEENEDSCSCSTLLYDGNTCPICLNCLLEQEIGFPESCSHIFCMTCILKWAEVRLSTKVCFYFSVKCTASNTYRFFFVLKKVTDVGFAQKYSICKQILETFLLNAIKYFVFSFTRQSYQSNLRVAQDQG